MNFQRRHGCCCCEGGDFAQFSITHVLHLHRGHKMDERKEWSIVVVVFVFVDVELTLSLCLAGWLSVVCSNTLSSSSRETTKSTGSSREAS